MFAKALSSNCRRSAAFSNDLTGDCLKGSLNFVWETMDLNKLHIMWEQGGAFLLHFSRHTTAPLSQRPCGMTPALRTPSKQPSVCVCAHSLPLSCACSRTTSQNVCNPEEKSTFGCLAHTLRHCPLGVLQFLIAQVTVRKSPQTEFLTAT